MHALRMQPFVPPEQRPAAAEPTKYRMLFVGAQGAGKYSLHHQFVYSVFPPIRDHFFDSEAPEILWKSHDEVEAPFSVNLARMNISRLGNQVANSPDGDHFYPRTVLPLDMFRMQEANGMVLVYSITSRSSFDALRRFIEARIRDSGTNTLQPRLLAIIGNKLDSSKGKRKILCFEGEELAQKHDCSFVECSAKDQKGLDKVRTTIGKALTAQKAERVTERGDAPPDRERKKLVRASSSHNSRRLQADKTNGVYTVGHNSNSDEIERDSLSYSSKSGTHFARPGFGTQQRLHSMTRASSVKSEDKVDDDEDLSNSQPQLTNLNRSASDTPVIDKKSRWLLGTRDKERQNVRSEAQTSRSNSTEGEKSRKSMNSPTSPVGQVTSISTLFPKSTIKKQTQQPVQPVSLQTSRIINHYQTNLPVVHPMDRLDPINPHPGTKVQLPSSVPASRRQSVDLNQVSALSSEQVSPSAEHETRKSDDTIQITPPQSPQAQARSSPPRVEYIPMPAGLNRSLEPPSPGEDRRQLEIETALLEAEREKLKDQMARLAEQRRMLAERRRLDEDRRKIQEERKKVEEERKRVEEEIRIMEEESRNMLMEQASFGQDIHHELSGALQEEPEGPQTPPSSPSPTIRSLVRSYSAINIPEVQEDLLVNPKRLSKDDSFLEPPPRNPLRSASRLGFRSPQLSPTVLDRLRPASGRFMTTLQPTESLQENRFPSSEKRDSPHEMFDEDKTAFTVPRASQDQRSVMQVTASPPHPTAPSVANTISQIRFQPQRDSVIYSRATGGGEMNTPPSIAQRATEHDTVPAFRSNITLPNATSLAHIHPPTLDEAKASLEALAKMNPDLTARVVRINRVSRSYEPEVDMLAAAPKAQLPPSEIVPPHSNDNSGWRNHNPQPQQNKKKYIAPSVGRQIGQGNVPQQAKPLASTNPPSKVLSLAERLKKRDEEDNNNDRGQQGFPWTNGFAVRATSLPSIKEHESTVWTDNRPRLPFPGRYV